MENVAINFFKLPKKDDAMVVRLLAKNVDGIERYPMHELVVEGNRKRMIRCPGEGCPICAQGYATTERVYLHMLSCENGEEYAWERPAKVLDALKTIENDWGDLDNVCLRIVRTTDEFPQYSITPLPPTKYPALTEEQKARIGQKVSFRYGNYRSKNELAEYLKTGVLPPHQKSQFLSKEEWLAKRKENAPKITVNPLAGKAAPAAAPTAPAYIPKKAAGFEDMEDDPFMSDGPFYAPTRV